MPAEIKVGDIGTIKAMKPTIIKPDRSAITVLGGQRCVACGLAFNDEHLNKWMHVDGLFNATGTREAKSSDGTTTVTTVAIATVVPPPPGIVGTVITPGPWANPQTSNSAIWEIILN